MQDYEVTHYSNFYELLFRSLEQQSFNNFYIEISAVTNFFNFTEK